MSSPFFSIIIPFYNSEEFIVRALDSVVRQTCSDYEILLVNDGSEDSSEAVIRKFLKDKPVKFQIITHGTNKGIGAARNSGLKAAQGRYVSFLDSDDIWFENKLETVKAFFDENPESDLVCHDLIWVEEGKAEREHISGPYTTYKDLLFKGNCVFTSGNSVKRNKVEEIGGFSENMDFNGVEDYDLWLRLSKNCKFFYLHTCLGEYHSHGGGITASVEKHNENYLNLIESHFQNFDVNEPEYQRLMNVRRGEVLRIGGRCFIKTGNFKAAKAKLLGSIKLNPTFKALVFLLAALLKYRF